jgi:hypothetical protein
MFEKKKKSPWRAKLGPFEKKKEKSPWRAKLGPFLKKWEIPLAGQTRADGKSHKEIALEKKVGFVLEINH